MKLPLLDLSLVSTARYLQQAILMLRGLVLAWLLEPAGYGVWASMRLVMVFGRYAHAGAGSGMVQRAAYEDGRGETQLAGQYRQTGAGVNLLSAGLVAAIIVIVVLLRKPAHTGWWLAIAALVFVTQGYSYYIKYLMSRRIFSTYAAMLITLALTTTGIGLWAAWLYGLGGFIAGLIIAHLLVLGTAIAVGPGFPRPRLQLRLAREIIVIGFPIMLATITATLLWNTDKLLIWLMRGTEPLGVYAIQAVFTSGVLLLPSAIYQVLRPHLLKQLGRSGNQAAAQEYLERGTLLLGLVACPVIGMTTLALHLPIRWLLPEYIGAIAPGQLLVMLTFLAMAASVPATVLVTVNAAWLVIMARILGVAVAAAVIITVIQAGGEFVAIASGTGAGLLVYSVMVQVLAYRRSRLPAGRVLRIVVGLVLSYTLLIILVLGLTGLIADATEKWTTDLALTALRCVLLAAIFIPLMVLVIRRYKLLAPLAVDDTSADSMEAIEPDIE